MRHFTFFLTVLISVSFFSGCTQEGTDFENKSNGSDTTALHFFTIHIPGHARTFEFSENAWVDSASFQAFLSIHYNKPLSFDTLYALDVTGDGISDTIDFHIRNQNGAYRAWSGIRSKQQLVFGDTALLDPSYEAMYFGVDSIPPELEPYMGYYICYFLKDFISTSKPDEMLDYASIRSFFYGSLDNPADTLYWNKHLKTYEGRLVGDLAFMDGDTYIWDEVHQKFLLYYSP